MWIDRRGKATLHMCGARTHLHKLMHKQILSFLHRVRFCLFDYYYYKSFEELCFVAWCSYIDSLSHTIMKKSPRKLIGDCIALSKLYDSQHSVIHGDEKITLTSNSIRTF